MHEYKEQNMMFDEDIQSSSDDEEHKKKLK